MIRTIYGYKTYNHAVFAGFLPGFISVRGCFYFANSRHGPFVQTISIHFFLMDNKEHSYAMADSSTISIHLLCGQDFPDAVPFHITEMQDFLSTHPGRYLLRMLCTTIIMAQVGEYYNYFLSIMACFLDEEEHREYIDVTSMSKDQDGPQAGAMGSGGLPTPPHQPPMEVTTMQCQT